MSQYYLTLHQAQKAAKSEFARLYSEKKYRIILRENKRYDQSTHIIDIEAEQCGAIWQLVAVINEGDPSKPFITNTLMTGYRRRKINFQQLKEKYIFINNLGEEFTEK